MMFQSYVLRKPLSPPPSPSREKEPVTPELKKPTRSSSFSEGTQKIQLEEARAPVFIEKVNRAAIVKLNRPKSLNAINKEMATQLLSAIRSLDASPDIGCIIITGNSEKAFCAGADIKMLVGINSAQAYQGDLLKDWNEISQTRTPIIACVNGLALGGGFELALLCSFIYATTKAKMGLPEVKIGTIPGAGGTQRLTRQIGKSKAMEMILTGDPIDGKEALSLGICNQLFESTEEMMQTALATATKIANGSKNAVMMAKECVEKSQELSLSQGLDFERRLYHLSYGTKDQIEGMNAFIEKRQPRFNSK